MVSLVQRNGDFSDVFFSGPVLDMLGSRSHAHRDENRLAWYHGRRKRGYVKWLRQAAKLSVKEL
jgi:hypothetical protein